MFIMADILPFCKVVKNSMRLSYCASQKKSIPFFVFLNKLFVPFIIFQTNPLSIQSSFPISVKASLSAREMQPNIESTLLPQRP